MTGKPKGGAEPKSQTQIGFDDKTRQTLTGFDDKTRQTQTGFDDIFGTKMLLG